MRTKNRLPKAFSFLFFLFSALFATQNKKDRPKPFVERLSEQPLALCIAGYTRSIAQTYIPRAFLPLLFEYIHIKGKEDFTRLYMKGIFPKGYLPRESLYCGGKLIILGKKKGAKPPQYILVKCAIEKLFNPAVTTHDFFQRTECNIPLERIKMIAANLPILVGLGALDQYGDAPHIWPLPTQASEDNKATQSEPLPHGIPLKLWNLKQNGGIAIEGLDVQVNPIHQMLYFFYRVAHFNRPYALFITQNRWGLKKNAYVLSHFSIIDTLTKKNFDVPPSNIRLFGNKWMTKEGKKYRYAPVLLLKTTDDYLFWKRVEEGDHTFQNPLPNWQVKDMCIDPTFNRLVVLAKSPHSTDFQLCVLHLEKNERNKSTLTWFYWVRLPSKIKAPWITFCPKSEGFFSVVGKNHMALLYPKVDFRIEMLSLTPLVTPFDDVMPPKGLQDPYRMASAGNDFLLCNQKEGNIRWLTYRVEETFRNKKSIVGKAQFSRKIDLDSKPDFDKICFHRHYATKERHIFYSHFKDNHGLIVAKKRAHQIDKKDVFKLFL